MTAEERLEERLKGLGHGLPDLATAPTHHNIKLYGLSSHVIPYRQVGCLLFTACVPTLGGRAYHLGTLGKDLSAEQGYEATRIAATSALLGLRYAVRDLERVEQILRVFCFAICTREFRDLTRVAQGAWDVLTDVLGRRGEHVSVPVGMTGISGGHSVELVLTTQVAG